MRFLFLGTSAGIPTRTRNVTALALQCPQTKSWALIDCGEGTQRQMQGSPCSPAKVSCICITHLHGDHVLGLPGFLASRAMQGGKDPLHVIGPPGLADYVEYNLKALHCRLPYELRLSNCESEQGFEEAGFRVQGIALHHGVPSWAYLWKETSSPQPRFLADKVRALGVPPGPIYAQLRAGVDAQLSDGRVLVATEFRGPSPPSYRFIVGGDNGQPELLTPFLGGAQLLIHESTYTQADFEALPVKHLHATAARVAKVAADAGLPSLILTHFSPRYATPADLARLADEARLHYQGQLELAADHAFYELSRQGRLQQV